MKHTLTIVLMSFALIAQAQTSNDNPKLKEGLKRFPEADANGDGVLTLEEAKAFKQKADKPDSTDDGGSGMSKYFYLASTFLSASDPLCHVSVIRLRSFAT